jgi:predicted nucleic acid-binding protein
LRACVLDASVVVKWYLDEPGSEAARALQDLDLDFSAPHLLLVEVANVLWKYVRQDLLDRAAGSQILSTLEEAPFHWYEDSLLFKDAFLLAAGTGRTVYDCLYISLAVREGRSLITADRRLYNALQTTSYAPHVLWFEDAPNSLGIS